MTLPRSSARRLPPAEGSGQAAPRYREHLPHPTLRPYIECYWSARGDSVSTMGRVLPDGCMDALFSLAGEAPDGGLPAGASVAVGTMTRALRVPRHPGMRLWGVRFRPGAGGAFLGVHASELTDRRLALSDLWGSHADEVWERLATSADTAQRVHRLDEVMRRRLVRIEEDLDPRVLATSDSIARGGHRRSVAQLAEAVDLGRRQLERCFSSAVGIPPGVAWRIQRLRRSVTLLSRRSERSLAQVAVRAGYADQAHFTREFRALTGTTPGAYRDEQVRTDVASVQDVPGRTD